MNRDRDRSIIFQLKFGIYIIPETHCYSMQRHLDAFDQINVFKFHFYPFVISPITINKIHFFFFAVFADCLKAFAVGAPFEPTFRIFSPDPPLIRFRFA